MRRLDAARSIAESEEREPILSGVPKREPSGLYVCSILFYSLPLIFMVMLPFYVPCGKIMKNFFDMAREKTRAKWVKNGENGRLLKRKSK
jgi:hypothetical protein